MTVLKRPPPDAAEEAAFAARVKKYQEEAARLEWKARHPILSLCNGVCTKIIRDTATLITAIGVIFGGVAVAWKFFGLSTYMPISILQHTQDLKDMRAENDKQFERIRRMIRTNRMETFENRMALLHGKIVEIDAEITKSQAGLASGKLTDTEDRALRRNIDLLAAELKKSRANMDQLEKDKLKLENLNMTPDDEDDPN